MTTTIPAPPPENTDPWFDQRAAFDEAVRTRLNDELSDVAISQMVPKSGTRMVTLGDSLTSADGGGAPSMGWVMQAGMVSAQQLSLTFNAGVVGENAGQMLARLETSVLSRQPNFVTVWAGTNDITQGRTLAAFQADIAAIVERLQIAGCVVALFTIPPRSDSSKHATINAWNAWLRTFARSRECHLVDAYAVLVNPATGGLGTGYDAGDGIHLSQLGHNAIAKHVASKLVPRLVLSEGLRPLSNTDATNLVTNGLLISETSGAPTGWILDGPATGITESLVTDPRFRGKAWRVAAVNPAGARQLIQNAATAWSAGDRLLVTMRVSCESATGVSALKGLRVNVAFFGAADPIRSVVQLLRLPGLEGVAALEVTVPSGTTGPVQIASIVDIDSTASATYMVGEAAIFNLTTLGL